MERLLDFMGQFRGTFRRREQVAWAAVYLHGLLAPLRRKTIEAIAAQAPLPPELHGKDAAQALHHFLHASPWDECFLGRQGRALAAPHVAHPEAVLVLEDLAFIKDGQHSVGVHPQFSGSLGRKCNCQLAVVAHHIGPRGNLPLALRLYLPGSWLRDPVRLDGAGVPDDQRVPRGREQLGVDLLETLDAEGLWPGPVVAFGHGGRWELAARLSGRGRPFLMGAHPDLRVCQPHAPGTVRLTELPSRMGIHWYPLPTGRYAWLPVLAAPDELAEALVESAKPLMLLIEHGPGKPPRFVLTNLDAVTPWQEAVRLWHTRLQASHNVLKMQEIGIDHFEGRSWRGFHHHCQLVTLATYFQLGRATDSGMTTLPELATLPT